ncbi:allantoinase, mitochondrial [Lingula anatina]|uniref:allantoinase n=1 Tax=Lingula anatina TaxID=7574 RepID=A0A1S3JJ52_LINAN|nr:allantoinase, mitochondrial [Lingula anatina]|eukprot:XP_013409934.1 allantoinase, mitochondrial [Lingula anatina]
MLITSGMQKLRTSQGCNMADLKDKKLVKGRRIVFEDGVVSEGCIVIREGKIEAVHRGENAPINEEEFQEVIDAGNQVVMPGIVDSHVHVNEPGRTAWEGYETATKAAAMGGITTIVDMPLNSIPPTTTLDAFKIKMEHAQPQCYVDVAFWGGVVPGNEMELRPMINAGIAGFKCFLIHSGVDEFPHVTTEDLHAAMKQLQGTDSVLLFHAEVETSDIPDSLGSPEEYSSFLASRPPSMEYEAIKLVCNMCKTYRVPCHIVHLSAAAALPLIQEARGAGAPLTVETCHHYLNLEAATVPGKATQYKCCPPIRDARNQEILWQALGNGDIDMVVSDHSPCTPELKLLEKGDFLAAWGGIASVQFGLSLFWTGGSKRGFTLQDMVRLMCENTSKLAGLGDRKGKIRAGCDADLVIWDPEAMWKVAVPSIQHKNKITPYLDMALKGKVLKTILRGQVVYSDTEGIAQQPMGQLLLKTGGK